MIQEDKGEATVHQADLTEESSCQQMLKRGVEVYGRVDILDNNVGIGSSLGGILQTTEEEWDRLFAVNLKTMIFCSKAVIPYMKHQGVGSVINIASYSGIRHSPMIAYGSTKAAMIHLTKIMAVDHGRDNIRVNCIAPGYIDTPLVSSSSPMTPERRKKREEAAPLGRQGTAWEVGWAAVFLASDEASFITGTVLTVDGGRSCKE
jgi:NAD(P)-dependent dehydrogenase (short-subunit alcohol dehydrogenase family)